MTRSLSSLMQSEQTRRELVQRAAAAGISVPLLAGLVGTSTLSAVAQDSATVQFASNGSDPAPRARMEGAVENYNAEGRGFTVEINTTEHEAFKQAIRTYLASDDPPDVLTWFAGNRMRFFSNNGLLMPLDDLFAESGWDTAFPEGILSVSKGTDGTYYFVPTSYYHWAVWYRPSVFEELGLEVPETWDQFLALVDALAEAGKVPITIGTNQPWTAAAWFDYINMRVNGPEYHIQLMDGEVAYNTQEVKDVFGRWRELLDRQAFLPQPEAYRWQDALTPFVQGDAGLYLMGRFIVDSYPDEQEGDLDFFRFPVIDEGVAIGEDAPTDGFFAAAKAPNPEGAKDFLTFLGSAETQQWLVEQGGSPAVHQDVPLDLYDDITRRGVEMLQESDLIAQFYDRDTHPDMAERGMSAFQEFWNNPDDIDGILDRLDEERKRVFEAES
jgi:multiple sugar transport system substrate-binding protein/raffinose/stachyose/melibiose transport system substrate-binding protein